MSSEHSGQDFYRDFDYFLPTDLGFEDTPAAPFEAGIAPENGNTMFFDLPPKTELAEFGAGHTVSVSGEQTVSKIRLLKSGSASIKFDQEITNTPLGQLKQSKRQRTAKKQGSIGSDSLKSDNDDDGGSDDEKKAKRRKQIAAASRMSRARRKRELEDLRDENERLRDERSQFLSKISELQLKVEMLREQGNSDMRIENELLRAQLEEHKRFVACFKQLSEGAPSAINARHAIYKQGVETAQAQVLGLISQSQTGNWSQATVPLDAELPYQNFSVFYKFKNEFDKTTTAAAAAVATSAIKNGKARQRLNVRVDVLFPGIDAASISDFFWNSFSDTATHARLFGVKGVEVTQLTDDMPDKDTKMLYYRERWEERADQDCVLICNRQRKNLALSTLALPYSQTTKPPVGKVAAVSMALSTTQHSAAPEYENTNRITSMFVQGAVIWNAVADCRLCVVFSFPDDVKLKGISCHEDVISKQDGSLTYKFCEILRQYRNALSDRL